MPRGMIGQLARFAAVGVASTLAYLLLYVLLRTGLGAFGANLVALVVTAVANTAANRRLTFGVRGRERRGDQPGAGPDRVLPRTGAHHRGAGPADRRRASRPVELLVLVLANALATVLRFVAFRSWIFARPHLSERAA